MSNEAGWQSHEDMLGRKPDLDLGDGHALSWTSWSPDRALNPQYEGIPDVERYGAIVSHRTPSGDLCFSGITFRGEVQARIDKGDHSWNVTQWEPLTMEPSLLCRTCGDHGFIRSGEWVRA